ncbi:MAG: hypothetical protein CL609_03850 [Anaerolineaceae bacterium]|nr:hypothetical protein [Anaerolineaceae bacterium]
MPNTVDTVLFAQRNYFRTSLMTIFEQIEIINLVGIYPFKNVFDCQPNVLKADLIVCILQDTKLSFQLSDLIQVLSNFPNQKKIIIGCQPDNDYDPKNIMFYPNITQLSKQVVKTYLDYLFIR